MVFVPSSNTISEHTKVTLPYEEAVKAPFPPGCKVLCFDENGFRVGIVKDVLIFISLHEEATYGTYYEVEIKGANLQSGKTSVFTASDLRLTPDCPVQISPEYFGSVFQHDKSLGNIEGIVLGSFEIPSAYDKNPQKSGKYFYSVRVKVPGMDEAVEAHGVPPDQVTVLSSVSENFDAASFANASIIIGGGSYDSSTGNDDETRTRTPSTKARRVTPEDMHADDDFDSGSVRDGFYQEQDNDGSFYDEIDHMRNNETPHQSIQNILSNTESHFYDTASESEYDKRSRGPPRKPKTHRSPSRGRSSKKTNTNRSVSRTRSYVRSQTPVRTQTPPVRSKPNRIPNHDDNSLARDYADYIDKKGNHNRNDSHMKKVPRSRHGDREVHDHNYVQTHPEQYENDEVSENSDTYREIHHRNISENVSDEEYDSIVFQESEDERRDNYGVQNVQQQIDSPRERVQEPEKDPVEEFPTPTSITSATSSPINSQSENQPNAANVRSATPGRKKAFGKTWTPTNQMKEKSEETEKPKVGKLDGGVRNFTPVKTRSTTPLPSQNTALTPKPVAKLPDTIPLEGCYFIFDSTSGGRFITQFSKTAVEEAIGFWAPGPGKKLQGFKFKQNQGRTDMMKGVAGKDYKKKYFSGWCQFVKAAKSHNGYFVKYSAKERIETDIYVFYNETCEIEMIEDAKLIEISTISAVACVAKGKNTFDGVKTGELGTFLNKGASAGASLSLM